MCPNLPMHLSHKPIYALDDYAAIDCSYQKPTDVTALSLGKAQWSADDEFVPSVKVWRRGDSRWSPQSEETTLTRALDLAMLVVKVVDALENDREVEPIKTLYGAIKIEEVDSERKEALKAYLRDPDHLYDIQAHIETLYAAIQHYKK